MPDLKFTGFPTAPGTVDALLRDWFGYHAKIQDDICTVPEDDPALLAGPADPLTIHHQIEIREDNFAEVADSMIEAVPAEFDRHAQIFANELPSNIVLPGGLGAQSEFHAIASEIAVASREQATHCIATRLLPFMQRTFPIKYVVPVSVQAANTQQYLSFSKVATLAGHVGTDDLDTLLRRAKVFSGIELSSLDILNFIEPVTRLAPVAFTFPVNRYGCTWHFHGEVPLAMNYQCCRSFFEEFLRPISPRTSGPTAFALSRLEGMDETNTWRVLATAVEGINRLMKYLHDPRNFLKDDGTVDFLWQLQGYGAIHMLFADIQAVNRTLDDHTRLSFAFSAVDKLANLRKHLGGAGGNEAVIASQFASLDQGKELRSVFGDVIGNRRPELAGSLTPLVRSCYFRLHLHLGRECGPGESEEMARLERLRFSRNLSHGTFLNNEAFQTLFMKRSGTVPKEILTLAYLLTWGLILDPQRFLRFTPE